MDAEAKILRFLAVLGLAAALLTVGFLAINTGVLGGGSGGVITAPAAASASFAAGAAGGSSDQSQQADTATTSGRTYTVQDGDTFYSIARKFNTTISDIQKLNPNIDPQNLTSGVKLVVPQ